jgi:hypothetical protein
MAAVMTGQINTVAKVYSVRKKNIHIVSKDLREAL